MIKYIIQLDDVYSNEDIINFRNAIFDEMRNNNILMLNGNARIYSIEIDTPEEIQIKTIKENIEGKEDNLLI